MAETITTPTTRLEAVNTMLRAIGESPVSTLEGPMGMDVPMAEATLDEVSGAVQTEGWKFNTEYEYPLPLDGDKKIPIPQNALEVHIPRGLYTNIDPVVRGGFLYDRKNHTYVFDQTLKAKIIFGLAFDELPESARYYITVRACRRLQDVSLGSESLHKFSQRTETMARARFVEQHSDDEDLNMIRDTPDFRRIT